MSKPSGKERVEAWHTRITQANKVYEKWAEKYRVQDLEDYYLGMQVEEDEDRYVINKVFPSIEISIPSLLFYNPVCKIKPRPTRTDDQMSQVTDRAKLQEDTINTFITDRRVGFKPETTLALKESFFRFGVVETGYTADFIDNPLLHKPELQGEEEQFSKLDKIPNPENPQPESLYIKRIPARQFRVSAHAKNILTRNDWCGYYEWQRPDDLKANPNYKNTSKIKTSGKINPAAAETVQDESERDADGHGKTEMVKVWKIWDLRGMKRYVLPDSGDKFFVDGETFKSLPFSAYKPHEILDSWYPIPPVFNWLDPQDEINDIRKTRRVHRKRMYRRYTYLNGSIDEDELKKLEDGGDGVYAKANRDDPIKPVPDAPLDMSIWRDDANANQDFREISGIGGEARGDEDPNTTATQANIVELHGRIRESYKRQNVAEWLASICTIMLQTIDEKMSLPFWIQMNTDPIGPAAMQEAAKIAEDWKMIVAADLGGLQLDITVDVTSLSPLSEEGERLAWTQVLALFTNPPLLAVLMSSEVMLRKTLSYYNVRSEREIREIQKAGQAMLAMVAAMQQQKAGGAGGAQGAPSPGPTPGNTDIAAQLTAQMGGVQ